MADAGQGVVWMAGPLLVGALFSYFLYGLLFLQTITYFQTTLFTKRFANGIALVIAVSVFELAHCIVMTITVFHVLAYSIPKGNMSFKTPPVSLAIAPLTTVLHVLVQGYFALRIRKISGCSLMGNVMALLIAALGLVQLAGSIAIAYFTASISRELGKLTNQQGHMHSRMVWYVANVLSDILITFSLVYLYRRFKRKTERPVARNWLRMLIRHTVKNGAIISVFSTLHIIFFLAVPKSLIYIGLAYFNTRLYSNVLLASLNNTRHLQLAAASKSSVSLSIEEGAANNNNGITPNPAQGTTISISRSTRRHSLTGPCETRTRTEDIQLTTVDLSMDSSDLRSGYSCQGHNVPEGYWKHGCLGAKVE